jgi:DNA invertase Pin-like site-specific DNA recombinase
VVKKKKEEVEIIDAEIVEEISNPDLDFEKKKKSLKKPRGKRKKDFPEFTPNTREKVIQITSLGSPPEITAKAAGIHPRTLQSWLKRGENTS